MFTYIKNPDGSIVADWDADPKIALQKVMDYHEEHGCKAYLELYPAPEKGEWDWIAQDYSGKWWGYKGKPVIREAEVVWTEPKMRISGDPISQSPPNPFWRKTLR